VQHLSAKIHTLSTWLNFSSTPVRHRWLVVQDRLNSERWKIRVTFLSVHSGLSGDCLRQARAPALSHRKKQTSVTESRQNEVLNWFHCALKYNIIKVNELHLHRLFVIHLKISLSLHLGRINTTDKNLSSPTSHAGNIKHKTTSTCTCQSQYGLPKKNLETPGIG
jgi:hypothetical protein